MAEVLHALELFWKQYSDELVLAQIVNLIHLNILLMQSLVSMQLLDSDKWRQSQVPHEYVKWLRF